MVQSVSGHNSEQSIAHYIRHGQLYCSYKVSPILCGTGLRITNHRGHKFPPSVTLLTFKTRIKWPPVLTSTASFPSVFFQLLQYSRQHPTFSAHKPVLMTKNDLIFPVFSLRFVDFAVQFCPRCKFSFHETPFGSSLTVACFFWTNHNS